MGMENQNKGADHFIEGQSITFFVTCACQMSILHDEVPKALKGVYAEAGECLAARFAIKK